MQIYTQWKGSSKKLKKFVYILNGCPQSETEFGTKRGSDRKYKLDSASSAFSIVCLYVLQMGSHTSSKKLAPRLLTLTMSILTLLVFIFYTGDITADMTSGPSDIPIHNFEDVIYHNYKVVTFSPYYEYILASSNPGSAMLEVHNTRFEMKKDHEDALNAMIQDTDSKTLYYGTESSNSSLTTLCVSRECFKSHEFGP